jgi:nucleotide-binding universal stress UspA family protein
MSTHNRQVVVACDFSEQGKGVLDAAVSLAKTHPECVLHIVAVLDPRTGLEALPLHGTVDITYADGVRDFMAAKVAEAIRNAHVTCDVTYFLHARIGAAALEILDLAKEVGADTLLIGTHGYTGFRHLVMGSVAERVVREAGCPVTVVRAKTYPDVELEPVIEVAAHARPKSKMYRFSYENHNVIMRPPDWPIH